MIVAVGSNDTLASPGTQLDFYQAILDKMGRSKVDSFARLYVLPQTGHGLTGSNYSSSSAAVDMYPIFGASGRA